MMYPWLAQTIMPSAQQWALIGLLGMVGLAVLAARMRGRPRDGSPRQYRREIDESNGRSEEIRRDMERLLAELGQLSSTMNSQLEGQHQRLQEAIQDADQRIFALRSLLQAAGRAGEEAAKPGNSEVLAGIRRVHALADEGLAAMGIAQRLNLPVGEVELILNLRRVSAPTA